MQDKATPPRRPSPFGEPQNIPPAQETQKHHGSNQRRVRQVGGYLMPEEFAEVERMRGTGENRLMRGKVVSKLLAFPNFNFSEPGRGFLLDTP